MAIQNSKELTKKRAEVSSGLPTADDWKLHSDFFVSIGGTITIDELVTLTRGEGNQTCVMEYGIGDDGKLYVRPYNHSCSGNP